MIILGLTGTIGSGKTFVSSCFRAAGVPVFDADRSVHVLLGVGGAAVAPVLALFPNVGSPEAGIDRTKLAEIVFNDAEQLRALEKILHPMVREMRTRYIRYHAYRRTKLLVLDVPLLFETGIHQECNYTAVVYTPAIIRHQRLWQRDHRPLVDVMKRERQQISDHEKRERATFVIHNGQSRGYTRRQVIALIRRLRG